MESVTSYQNYNRVKNNLENLNLLGFSAKLDEVLAGVERGELTFLDALHQLTEKELKLKQEKIYQYGVKKAGFPYLKSFKDFDFDFQPSLNKKEILGLESLRFMEKHENILLMGSPGTGKTHISVALGIEAAKNRFSTYFISCQNLLMQLKKAKQENRLEQRLKLFARYKLLIIDEVGFLSISDEESKLLFQLISMRYEKYSTIITTNKELSEWNEVFPDPVLANAILDRVLHHCQLIRIVGPSYRTQEALKSVEKGSLKV